MTHAFTPATERALQAAAAFHPRAQVGLAELLLGLLSESECLAATLLAEHQIDAAAVLAEFPELTIPELSGGPAISTEPAAIAPELRHALRNLAGQCDDLPLPYELATEHLLLGVLLSETPVAAWLIDQGLDAARLEQQIRARYRQTSPAPPASEETSDAPWDAALDDASTPATPPPVAFSRLQPRHASDAAAHELAAWRVIDASANRAREGLRVVEDYARFALDDTFLTGELKRLRHDLADALAPLPRAWLYAARDTAGDVGTRISTDAEAQRIDLDAILAANFLRTAEALRSLEEFAKFVAPELSPRVEQLRYRTYTLERAVGVTAASLRRLAGAWLYVLIDGGNSFDDCSRLAQSLIAAGVHVLQLRDKRLGDAELLERARHLRKLTSGTRTLLIINDRADIARQAGADGVHVGQEDLDVRAARGIVGPEALVGVSTHSLEQARRAVLDGADYLGVGPTFPSGTKRFAAFTGVELLAAVAGEIRLPAFAIGGINLERLPAVQAAGFSRIAVSGAVASSADPGRAAAELLQRLAQPAAR